jgi:hypothetical protein
MPSNSDETAYVLWAGGCYIKSQDAETADLFYKSLVRRNRKTALGAEADRIRWFPKLDESGNVIVRSPNTSSEVLDVTEPAPDASTGSGIEAVPSKPDEVEPQH